MQQNPTIIGYRRVSGIKQVTEGDGLGSQEARITEYARNRGYPALSAMFTDNITGGTDIRPGIKAMLQFLVKHRNDNCIVVIDDITRLARDVEVHRKLRRAIAATGAKLECPSFEFGDSPDEELVELLLASVSQHQRRKNAEQVVNRMKGRLQNGYWCFSSKPPAYQFAKVAGQNTLVRRDPIASIVTEALEGFASGRFQTRAEVQRFLEGAPGFPKQKDGAVKFDKVTEMLTNVLYAGHIEYLPWEISIRPGQHVGLISLETYQKIQDRLSEKPKTPARADLSEHFPLRQAVRCAHCGRLLSGAYSRGNGGEYAYYFCPGKKCPRSRKGIKRDEMHNAFDELLKGLVPTCEVIDLATDIFRETWAKRADDAGQRVALLEREIKTVDKSIELLVDRVANATSPQLVAAYEKRLLDLDRERAAVAEKVASTAKPLPDFDATLRTALDFLANPWKLWDSGRLEDQRAVCKLVFTEHLDYAPESGFRTAETTLPFKVLDAVTSQNPEVVPRRGLEPPRLAAHGPEPCASTNSATWAGAPLI